MVPRLIAYSLVLISLCSRPSAPLTSGSALRRTCSSGFQPHFRQQAVVRFMQAFPLFGRPHGIPGRPSFFSSGILNLLYVNPEPGSHEFPVSQILLCPGRPGLDVLDDELSTEFVRKVRRVPHCADALASLGDVSLLQGELRLQAQIGDNASPEHHHQLVIPPRLLLAVEPDPGPLRPLVVVLRIPPAPLAKGSWRRSA